MKMDKRFKFFVYAGGIFVSYFIFGMLQEKIMRGKYGDDNDGNEPERYTYALFIVLVQCVCNLMFAKVMLSIYPQESDPTRTLYYFSSALTYLLAMVCSNMALQWVNYPTQVVGKSAKPIPVMILGVLIGHKTYPLRKYIFVFLIVIGVILFMFKDHAKSEMQSSGYGVGELLLLLSLTMDGLTGAVQDRMRAEGSPSALQMMVSTNYWSVIILGIGVVLSGEVFGAIEFITRHPIIISHMALLAITGALGQLFIFLAVSQFGPLSCSVVTTTRKFFTVLASVIIFGNALFFRQWIGAVLVFAGLFLDMFYGKSPLKPVAKA